MKLNKIVILSLFALTLTACGSGGGQSSSTIEPESSSTVISSSEEPSSKSEEFKRLETPTLIFDGVDRLSWNAVDDVYKYELLLNDDSVLTDSTYVIIEKYGVYTAQIRALSDTVMIASSSWSEVYSFEKVEIFIGNVILLESYTVMTMSDEYQIEPLVDNYADAKFEFLSLDYDVIDVDEQGIIIPKDVGIGKIVVTSTGYKPAYLTVEVKPIIYSLIGSSATIDKGDTIDLNIKALPALKDNEYIAYESSDSNVAVVGITGVVNGVKPGEAVITATCSNGASTSVKITVMELLPAFITFDVNIPNELEEGCDVYLVGNFNNWTVCDETYKLTKVNATKYQIRIDTFSPKTSISYKYILGYPTQYSWEAYNGDNLANRTYNITSGEHTVNDTVTVWQEPISK